MEAMKTEILSALRTDISALLRSELKSTLAEEFEGIKTELQAVKAEVVNNITLLRSDLDTVKQTVSEMEKGLTVCSDDMTELQTSVRKLQTEMAGLQEKCVDLEGRMRRSNIRIFNVAEEPGSSSTTSVSNLLKEALHMEREILVDRSHRGAQPRRPDGRPRVIVAKLHYYQDCIEVLRRAREAGTLQFKGSRIHIFPDYPPSVVRARAAFSEVKKLLRGRDGIRYGLRHPARLRITHNGTEKEFCDPAEALAYVQTNFP